MTTKILLVEGESDKKFFEKLFDIISLKVEVKVSVPKDLGAEGNGKLEGFELLKTLLSQLKDGSITNLAMIVDADYSEDGWGVTRTLSKVNKEIIEYGYEDSSCREKPGLIFSHPYGLKSFGLWIMPDNESEGMFEDWVQTAVTDKESSLLEHAVDTVNKLPQPPKFKPIRSSKAKIATWMAWQKLPGEGLHTAINKENINENLINLDSPPAQNLIAWLKEVYEAEEVCEAIKREEYKEVYEADA